MQIPIEKIRVGKRRRENLGDLRKLMLSIQTRGLLHPVVIDDQKNLVAGERRLESCKRLGHSRIEVKNLGELTKEEHREIELEENLLRKDLTEAERSKKMVERIRVAEEIEESDNLSDSSPRRQGQRKKSTRTRALARITDDPNKVEATRKDVERAEAHVAAISRYPFLADSRWGQKPAIEMAELLGGLKEPDVELLLSHTSNGLGGKPGVVRKIFESWRDATIPQRRAIRKRLKGADCGQVLSMMADIAPSPDEALLLATEMRKMLARLVKRSGSDEFREWFSDQLERIEAKAARWNEQHIKRLRKEVRG